MHTAYSRLMKKTTNFVHSQYNINGTILLGSRPSDPATYQIKFLYHKPPFEKNGFWNPLLVVSSATLKVQTFFLITSTKRDLYTLLQPILALLNPCNVSMYFGVFESAEKIKLINPHTPIKLYIVIPLFQIRGEGVFFKSKEKSWMTGMSIFLWMYQQII